MYSMTLNMSIGDDSDDDRVIKCDNISNWRRYTDNTVLVQDVSKYFDEGELPLLRVSSYRVDMTDVTGKNHHIVSWSESAGVQERRCIGCMEWDAQVECPGCRCVFLCESCDRSSVMDTLHRCNPAKKKSYMRQYTHTPPHRIISI